MKSAAEECATAPGAGFLAEHFRGVPLDSTDVPQSSLDLTNKKRTNPFPWRGQFSPELVEVLLARYATPRTLVLDPFAGVGTVLFEAARRGIRSVGADINPAAVAMAGTAAFIQLSRAQRRWFFEDARKLMAEALPDALPLFRRAKNEAPDAARTLGRLARDRAGDPYLSNILANVLIRMAESGSPPGFDAALRALRRHEEIVDELPHAPVRCDAYHADARRLPLGDAEADLALTSPPYVNVFNYHQNFRAEMEALGWELLTVARSELGSNRKNRGNRFLTVVQYCLDMAAALAEIRRTLRPNGRAILVVGRESKVRGIVFKNGEIVAALASPAGWSLARRQERKFVNKFGETIFEDILHFTKRDGAAPESSDGPRDVARRALAEALARGPAPDVASDIERAVVEAETAPPSPYFDATGARTP